MSERGQVTPRDVERLSAYLDGRLERSEAARLEAQLSQDPQLRLELQELRATVRALSSLPRMPPPRSFTLQSQTVGRRTGYPFLQLGTALAALSFLVVVGADLLLERGSAAFLKTDAQFAAPAGLPEVAAEAPALDQSLEQAPEATPAAAESDLADDAQARAAAVAPTGTAPAGEPEGAQAPAELPQEAELQASADRVSELGGQEPAAAEPAGETSGEAAQPVTSFLRAAEIGLGTTAIVLGALTVRARRRAE